MMAYPTGSREAAALEAGWRFIERRGDRVQLECIACGARADRSYDHYRHLHLPRCAHPLVDEATPYDEDVICQHLVQTCSPMSLADVGRCIGVTRERARQIEVRALRKLQQAYLDGHLTQRAWLALVEAWEDAA